MPEVKIKAEARTEFGKGAARRIRRAGKVPGVLYGHGNDPIHITLPGHELMLALKTPNVLLDVEVNGKTELSLPKQVQRDPIKGFLEHVDLLMVKRGEKVSVDVPLSFVGEAAPGTFVATEHTSITVEAEATHIPGEIEVSIEGLEAGSQIHASDLQLPAGVTLQVDPELLIVNVSEERTAEVETEAAEEGVEGEGAAEAAEESADGESEE